MNIAKLHRVYPLTNVFINDGCLTLESTYRMRFNRTSGSLDLPDYDVTPSTKQLRLNLEPIGDNEVLVVVDTSNRQLAGIEGFYGFCFSVDLSAITEEQCKILFSISHGGKYPSVLAKFGYKSVQLVVHEIHEKDSGVDYNSRICTISNNAYIAFIGASNG
jgi:hypothetical protein